MAQSAFLPAEDAYPAATTDVMTVNRSYLRSGFAHETKIWRLCMSLPDYRQIDDARLAILQSYWLFRDVKQRLERTQRYDLGLVSRKPPGRPVTDDMSDMETNIQGEIREYYERQQEEHGDTIHFWIQRG